LTDARINYGNLLKETGQLEAAAERYRSAYCHDNADFVALSNLGQTLFQLDQCEEAHRTLAQVKRLRSLFIPGESDDFGSHFLTTEPLCISRIVDNPQIHLTSMSHLASEACGETISVLTFWRSSVPMGPFELPTARAMNQVRSSGSISAIFPASEESKIDPAVVRVVATRYTMDPEPKMLAHFGSGVVVSRAADNALIATAYHTLTFPGCVPTPAVNANDAVQSEADLIRVQFLSDAPLEREARIVWRAIGNGKAEDVALLRVIGIPDTIPAAEVRRSVDLEADAPLAMVSWSKTGVRRSIKTVYRGTIDRGKRLVMSNLGFQSGDSGAPVFGSDGKVVGLVAGASSDESGIGRTGAQAIPIQAIADALARLNTTTCQAEDS
jgi:S1-C subfamily serine protease